MVELLQEYEMPVFMLEEADLNMRVLLDTGIPLMETISHLEGEKISLGLMLFGAFKPKGINGYITTTLADVKEFCRFFSPEHFRFSLCEFNNIKDLGDSEKYKTTDANEILDFLKSEGYDVKLFFSYGKEKKSACGMLAGRKPDKEISLKWKGIEERAIKLVEDCSREIEESIETDCKKV